MPGANLGMPLKHVAVRQRWKDPSLELKLQYHDIENKNNIYQTLHSEFYSTCQFTAHVVCSSGEVSARAGRLQYF